MDCGLIFYSARKTSFCERSLCKSFSELGLNLQNTAFAIDNKGVGSLIIDIFKKCNIIFIIANLSVDDKKGIKYILSNALSNVSVDECKKLKNDLGEDGYVIRAENQFIIVLPDEPEQIEAIMQGPIGRYILMK